MKAAPFEYHAAATVEQAVALLDSLSGDDVRVLAGGQSFVPMMAFRLARPGHVVDINRIAELGRLRVEDGCLAIGATVRHSALQYGTTGGRLGQLLAAIVPSVAHLPIRNRGTFCGSLAHADPAAEWCLAVATLECELVLRSTRGTRRVAGQDFFQGIMTTAVEGDELLVECRMALLPDSVRFGFEEVSRRSGDFAMAAALACYDLQDGRIAAPRLGMGGVEPVPRRLAAAEAALLGQRPDPDLFARVAEIAAETVDPMPDPRNPPAFRRRLTRGVVRRALDRSLT